MYGVPNVVPISEAHPTEPISAYGIGKLAVEKYLHMYHRLEGIGYCALRLSNPFGPRQRPDKAQGVVTAFLACVLRNEEVAIWGDGQVVRDYLYVGDAVRAIVAAGDSSYCGVVNVGSGKGLSINQVLELIENVVGAPARRRYITGRAFDVPSNILDISRAASAIGWAPSTSFQDGLRLTAEFLAKANPRQNW